MKMTFDECALKAQEAMAYNAEFDVVGPYGRIKARWIDPYICKAHAEVQQGLWEILMEDDLSEMEYMGHFCENLTIQGAA